MTKLVPTTVPRAALVTGGGRRLGRAIALELAGAGFDVAVHFRTNLDAAEEVAAEIRRLGRKATLLHADLCEEDDTAVLIANAQAALGPVGVLVNNASTFQRDEWDDATRASWDHHMLPNLRAPFVLMQNFARALPNTAEGVIVNMLDERVWAITPHFVSYTVSKVGLWALTQAMALALAPRIRVNGIGPGPALASTLQTQEQFDRLRASLPLSRGTSPDEIGRALLAILCLPSLTGQMLALDGGQHLQWASPRYAQPFEE